MLKAWIRFNINIYTNKCVHLAVFIELHDNPHRVSLDDPDQSHDVGVVQIFHQACDNEENTTLYN